MTKRKTNWASMSREISGTSVAGPRQIAPGEQLIYRDGTVAPFKTSES